MDETSCDTMGTAIPLPVFNLGFELMDSLERYVRVISDVMGVQDDVSSLFGSDIGSDLDSWIQRSKTEVQDELIGFIERLGKLIAVKYGGRWERRTMMLNLRISRVLRKMGALTEGRTKDLVVTWMDEDWGDKWEDSMDDESMGKWMREWMKRHEKREGTALFVDERQEI